MASIEIQNYTDTIDLMLFGGNGGGGMALPKPGKIPGGKTARWYGHNNANHALNISISIHGYEI